MHAMADLEMVFNTMNANVQKMSVMENDEEIRAQVSIWRESKKFLSIGGREGMLVLTDKHLSFIHKTTAKIKWWKAITQRQALIFMKSKDTMIHHDGYDEKDLVIDQKNPKNTVLSFNDILNLEFEEKEWGSVLTVEYSKNGKSAEKHVFGSKDWVKFQRNKTSGTQIGITKFIIHSFVQFINQDEW